MCNIKSNMDTVSAYSEVSGQILKYLWISETEKTHCAARIFWEK